MSASDSIEDQLYGSVLLMRGLTNVVNGKVIRIKTGEIVFCLPRG